MERTLSLVLDKFGHKSITLMKGDNDTIDAFTTKFENSEEIREKFGKKDSNISTFKSTSKIKI